MRTKVQRLLGALLAGLTCAVVILLGAGPAAAHDDTGDAIALTVTDERVLGTAFVAFGDLGYDDTSGDGLLDAEERSEQDASVAEGLVAVLREHVTIAVDGEETVLIGAGPAPAGDEAEPSAYVEIAFVTGPYPGDASELDLTWTLASPNEQVLVSVDDDLVAAHLSGDGDLAVSLSSISAVRSFFTSGLDHVASGLDHLLFLVVLTFAVVGSVVSRATTWRVVKLVTAFTVGHAVSLGLAYFGIVPIPVAIVEPAIALSVVATAFLALRKKGESLRPWVAALVGVVHGLGFASSLGSLGLAAGDQVAALAAFNLGI
ncbi:HupE/UreJ family protein, partial [Nocardioides sp.]|uniref:HupE/UreJ family protein n=1 Tax=Nocardioides sp. TaxID=35761 RepID=UPI002B26E458